MEIGEYIRTRLGISKIIEKIGPDVCEVDKNGHPMSNRFSYYVENGEILKCSKNILELIEAGDYVNGEKVDTVFRDGIIYYDKLRIHTTEYNDYYEEDIKTIVTREQFKSMQYKLETEDK